MYPWNLSNLLRILPRAGRCRRKLAPSQTLLIDGALASNVMTNIGEMEESGPLEGGRAAKNQCQA